MTENKGDLISRDALKKEMQKADIKATDYETLAKMYEKCVDNAPTVDLKDIYQEGHYDGYLEGYTKAINEERPQGEWIPVSERLPEGKTDPHTNDFEIVLCTTIWEDVRPYRFGKWIGENKAHFWLCGGIMDKYITAWQPLPEPYKRGKEE